MRTRRTFAAVVLIGLAGTACGARLPADVHQSAANAVLNGGSQASTGTAPAPISTAPATTTTPPASSSSCPPSGTSPGLTPTTMTLGTIADRTGPVSGLFAGAQEGANAFSAYVNSLGGICGHKTIIDFQDSATSCTLNQNATSSLVSKVFAFIGSFSLYDGDGCGGTVLKAHPTVPDIHVALDPTAETPPNHYDIEPGPLGYATGMFRYYKAKYGSKVQQVGTITEDIPSAMAKQNAQEHSAETQGWKFVYSVAAASTQSNFTQYFQTMCAKDHIKIFYTSSQDAQNAATMIANEHSIAACKGVINIIPIAYDASFIPDFQGDKSELNGLQGWNEYSLFFNASDAANIPEVALFQKWFRQTNPGQPMNLYAMFAWADGRMLQTAFEHAKTGDQAGVMAVLNKLRNWDNNGLISPTTPSSKTTGNHCYILWQLQNGLFSRQSTPKASYRCDGTWLPYNKG